ncbi:2,4-dienoyl-CoA reductase [Sporobacter termitidis DSM 10068]|uniref:2,4-dienoyl-CoA reductase n=1 Tax=Sporobacter termitidis DSM 10068 TaxID=1123282 RepID=A0A1M5YN30_9FIRM|nr:FAD-dependent oxidoreductase [Sporobacter termitidis]SHI13318.1 2,4-dienoyl-CoA reductase [Sporobacter termitidis DSM 10068]
MSTLKYPHLFEPVRVGGTLFRNRLFAAPTGPQALTLEGFPTPDVIAYYERKAIGGAAAVTVGEGIVDSKRGRGGQWHVMLDNPRAAHPLHRLTDAVTRHGAVASVELQHAGMYANRELSFMGGGARGVAYGPVECELAGRHILPMTEELIEETIEAFANAALFAKQCGFGMVTVHGGHGWLISQFVSPLVNTRKDKWGGSVENRARLPVAIADAIHKKCGADFPVEMRISGSECHAAGYGIDEGIALSRQLDGHVDLLHVSAGSHEVPEVFPVTHPSMFLEDGVNVRYAAEIKKYVKMPVAAVGALSDPALMEEIIASGQADVVEVARGLIAEPDLPNKARAGRDGEIKKCMRCFHCFSTLLSDGQFHCAVNPETSRELECRYALPVKEKKTVLVAGGGIGGLQAALTCAARGHNVVLCERSGRLGGALRCEEKVPFKQKLGEYIGYQVRAVGKAAVDVRLNTPVTKALAEAIAPDVIIAALGGRPVVPGIRGIDGKNVLSAEEAYINPEKAGRRVVILGGGLVGVELAIYLAQLGRTVTVVEMLDRLNDGGNFLHMMGLNVELARYHIGVALGTKAAEINEKGVVGQGPDGERLFEADTVVYAVGQRPLDGEAAALSACAPEFYMIGDCSVPKNIAAATSAAYTVARDIGVY